MDVERTIEFILQMQAKSEAKLDQLAEELAAERLTHERRMNAMDERLRRIVRVGVQEARAERRRRRAVEEELEAEGRAWRERTTALDRQLAQLGSKIDAFIDSMGRGGNGHPRN